MKFRIITRTADPGDDAPVTALLRNLAGRELPSAPPMDGYWGELRARTNARIDEVTSPKALTISWALRVALPGVLAIASFMIGLRYFVPMHPKGALPLQAVVLAMPEEDVDTLLADPSRVEEALSAADLEVDPFSMSKEDVEEYLLASANVGTIAEALNDDQVTDVLTVLGSRRINHSP